MKTTMGAIFRVLGYFVLILLFTGVLPGTVAASAQDELVAKGNKAYAAGSFDQAATVYLKVIEAGSEAPELFYNLGNCYFKLHDYARAILWYERAKRLDPGNEDIDFNLNVANTKISDKIDPLPEIFFKRWGRSIVQLISHDTWAWFSVFALFAGILAFVLFLVSNRLFLRKTGFWGGITFAFLFLVFLLFAWFGRQIVTASTSAIVFAPTITVKSSPDEKSTDLFVVHEGTKVLLMDHIGEWYEIRIANGSVGWLPASSLEKI